MKAASVLDRVDNRRPGPAGDSAHVGWIGSRATALGTARRLVNRVRLVAAVLLFATTASAQTIPTGYQEYFVTGHEQHIYEMMQAAANDANCPGCPARVPAQAFNSFDNSANGWPSFMNSVVGAVASADGQRIYYDQWEDGFDSGIDPALGSFTPAQASTLVLGDGDNSNGRACEFTTDVRLYPCNNAPAHDDTIGQGTYLVFNSDQGTLRRVTSITRAGTLATVTTVVPHGMQNAGTHSVRISGANEAAYNGLFTVTVTGASTFTYTGGSGANATGTIWAAEVRAPTGAGACTTGPPASPQAGPPLTYYDTRNCSIPMPRSAADVRYDGGDRIVTSGGPLSVAHVQDPISPYIADAMEILSKQAVADAVSYSVPVGEDIYVNGTATEAFRRVFLDLVAFDDNTQVQINSPGAGTITVTLNRGQHYSSLGFVDTTASTRITINAGTKVSTTGPIFGMIYTAGPGNFATRHYALLPDLLHSTDYLVTAPGDDATVVGANSNAPFNLYILNPDPLNTISVTTTDTVGSCTNTISPNSMRTFNDFTGGAGCGGARYVPSGSTVRLTSSRNFWGLSAYDHQGTPFDWGHSWLAKRFLTNTYSASFSPGVISPAAVSATAASRSAAYVGRAADADCTIPPTGTTTCDSMNRSPLFVSAAEDNTLVKVDLDHDGLYDYVDTAGFDCPVNGTGVNDGSCAAAPINGCAGVTYTSCVYRLNALQSLRIFDHTDYDNSGTQVVANKPVAMAWGEDTDRAVGSDPILDAGYTVYPVQQAFLDPVLTIDKAATSTTVPMAGGLVTYTLTTSAYRFGPLSTVQITDLLPAGFACSTYQTGTTLITYPNLAQGATDPACAPDTTVTPNRNRLTWTLAPDPYSLSSNETVRIRYTILFPAAPTPRIVTNRASASGTVGGSSFNASDTENVVQTDVDLFKASADDGSLQPGDLITYTLYARNTGTAPESSVTITDPIPPGSSFAGSITNAGTFTGIFVPAQNSVVWTAATMGSGVSIGVSSLISSGTTATATTSAAHGWATGVRVTIADATPAAYNGTYRITVTSPTQFSYAFAGSATTPATGAITATGPYALTFQVRVNPGVPDGTLIRNRAGYQSNETPYFLSNEVQPIVVGPSLEADKTSDPQTVRSITTLSRLGATAYATTSVAHGWVIGEPVTIAGATPSAYNGSHAITVTGPTTFTYALASDPGANASGTITATGSTAQTFPSDVLTFHVRVRNTGTGSASNVRIDDSIPANTTYVAGSMAFSRNASAFTSLTDAADADQGTVPAAVAVNAINQALGVATATTAAAHGFAPGQLVQIAGATVPAYNGSFVINTTPTTTTFTYAVPAGTTTPAGGTITATRPRFVLPSLGPGEDVDFRFQVTVTGAAGLFVNNQATISSSEVPPTDSNLVSIPIVGAATVTGHVWLDLDGNQLQGAGEPSLPNLSVVVTDSRGVTTIVTTNANGDYSVAVPAGSTSLNVTETDPDFPAGATLTTANDPQTVTAVAGSTVASGNVGYRLPGLTLGKTSDAVGNELVPGQTVTYTLTLTNNGVTTLSPVRIDDPLPANTTYVSGSGLVQIPTFRVTEYPIGATTCGGAAFTSPTCNLTLSQNLAQNYFAIVQGGDGDDANPGDTAPDDNYVAVTGDPFGTGGVDGTGTTMLTASGAANRIVLTRGGTSGAGNAWTGVVTVVECVGDCGTGPAAPITSITEGFPTATVTTTAAHGYATGDTVKITGANEPEYDGTWAITVTGATTFTYSLGANPAGGAATSAVGVGLRASRISERLTSITRVGTTATVTVPLIPVPSNHGYSTGDSVTISGATGGDAALYNGTFTIAVTSATQFTYTMAGTPGANSAGTLQAERNPLSGFKLVDARRVAHAAGAGAAAYGPTTVTLQQAATDQGRLVAFGSQNGAGCFTADNAVTNHQTCHVRHTVSGANTLQWTRGAWAGAGGNVTASTSVVLAVQWGRQWTVNRRNVTGGNGGGGADAVGEYNNSSGALFPAVNRVNTWVFATGHTNMDDTGDSAEGTLVTLGDGVNQNATETYVAAGQEVAVTKNVEAWTMTHPGLGVSYQKKASGDAGGGGSQAVTLSGFTYAPSNRMALVYAGSTETGQSNWARTMLAARYLNGTQIELSRPRSNRAFTAWVQGINFSGVRRSSPTVMHDPSASSPSLIVQDGDGYTLAPGETLSVTYQVQVAPTAPDAALVTNSATATAGAASATASVTDVVRRAAVDVEHDNAGYAGIGGVYTFAHLVTNLSSQDDSYDMKATSLKGWKVELLNPITGSVIATDLTGDGIWEGGVIINTGTLVPGGSREYFLRVTVPGGVAVGDQDRIRLTGTSRRDASVSDTATDQLTVISGSNGSVQILPDNSGVVLAGGSKVYPHRIFNNTALPDTFDLAIFNEKDPLDSDWTSTIYWDSNGDGSYTEGTDQAITNSQLLAAGASQLIFVKVDSPTCLNCTAANRRHVAYLVAVSRNDVNIFGAASDTTTVVEARSHDLSGGGTRSVLPNTFTTHPGTLTSRFTSAQIFELSLGPAALNGADAFLHPTQLWIDTNSDGVPDTLIATDTNGDGTWDSIVTPAVNDPDGDLLPEVSVAANGQLAYELRRDIDAGQVLQSDSVTLTAIAPSADKDSVTATWIISAATRASLAALRVDPLGSVQWVTGQQRGTSSFSLYATQDPTGREGRRFLGQAISPRPDSMTPIPYRLETGPIPESYIVIEETETSGAIRTLGPFLVGDKRLDRAMTSALRRFGPSRQTRKRSLEDLRSGATLSARPAGRRHAPSRPPAGPRREAVKVFSRGSGELAVPLRRLVAAGLSLAESTPLRVTHAGKAVLFTYGAGPEGRELRFRVSPLVTDYTDEDVHVVTYRASSVPGLKARLTISGDPLPAPGTTRVSKATGYVADAPADWDPWLWDGLLSDMGPWPYADVDPDAGTFDLPHLAPSAPDPVPVRVRVYGYTEHVHTVTARLNDQVVGEATIVGRAPGLIEGSISPASLLAAGNKLTLEYSAEPMEGTPPDAPGGVFLDHLDLDVATWVPRLEPTALERYAPDLPPLGNVEYLVVTHPDFAEAAATIAQAKQAEGLSTAILTTDAIYDHFSAGFVEARAIQAAIRYGASESHALRFVLLIGDDTFDNNDYAGTGARSYVPSLLYLDPMSGRVPSENLFADLDRDGRPDLAIGRLPVQTAEQARAVADKVARQGEWLSAAPGRHLLAVDNSNAEDAPFAEDAAEMAALLPPGLDFSWARVSDGAVPARQALEQAWGGGVAVVHYFGHAGQDIWADEQLVSTARVEQLGSALAPAVVFNWACSAGWFSSPWGNSVDEQLVLTPGGGALASFGPVGITYPAAQRMMYEAFYPELYGDQTLGETIATAKRNAGALHPAARGVIEGFALLGDPALRLPPPAPALP